MNKNFNHPDSGSRIYGYNLTSLKLLLRFLFGISIHQAMLAPVGFFLFKVRFSRELLPPGPFVATSEMDGALQVWFGHKCSRV